MNHNVIITGSTRGIGLSAAAEFLNHGDRALIFCRHRGHMEEAWARLARIAPADHTVGFVGGWKGRDCESLIV